MNVRQVGRETDWNKICQCGLEGHSLYFWCHFIWSYFLGFSVCILLHDALSVCSIIYHTAVFQLLHDVITQCYYIMQCLCYYMT